jgi:hypothetical protein
MNEGVNSESPGEPQGPATPASSIAPPTVILPAHMLPVLPPAPTSWPMVLGIIATIVGSLGVMMYGCGSIMAPVMSGVMSTVKQSSGGNAIVDAQFQVQSDYMWVQLGVNLASLGLSTLLLCTGIGLMRRRPWTRTAAMTWAVLRIMVAVVATVVQMRINDAMFLAMQQAMQQQEQSAGGAMPAMPFNIFGLMRGFGYIGGAISMVWYGALPLFTLIWFLRRKIKAEVESWRQPLRA